MAARWHHVAATSCRCGGGAPCPRAAGATRHCDIWRGYQTKEGSEGNLVRVLVTVRRDEVAGNEIGSTVMELPWFYSDGEVSVV